MTTTDTHAELQSARKPFLRRHWRLLAILLLATLLRLPHLDNEFYEVHGFREAHDAMMARYYYQHGLEFLEARVVTNGLDNAPWVAEYPLFPQLVSLVYRAFGLHEYLGRLLCLLFSLAAIYMFYRLITLLVEPQTGLWAALSLAIAPLFVYYGRAFMRQELCIFLVLSFLYWFALYTQGERWWLWLPAVVAGSLALLVNAPTAYAAIPAFYLVFQRYRWRVLRRADYLLMALVIGCLAAAWYARALAFHADPLATRENFPAEKLYTAFLLPEFWHSVLHYTSLEGISEVGLVLALFGLLLRGPGELSFFRWYLVAVLIYFCCDSLPMHWVPHNYYYLNILPPLCFFQGLTFNWLWNQPEKTWLDRRLLRRLILVVVLVEIAITLGRTSAWYEPNPSEKIRQAAAHRTRALLPVGAKIIVDEFDTAIMYHSFHPGWYLKLNDMKPQVLDHVRGEGAQYLIITHKADFLDNATLHDYAQSQCTVVVDDPQFMIYQFKDLKP